MSNIYRNQSSEFDLYADIQTTLGRPPDLICRTVVVHEKDAVHCIYLESVTDNQSIEEYVLKSVANQTIHEEEAPPPAGNHFMREYSLSHPYDELRDHAVKALLEGYCVLIDGARERVCLINAANPKQRPIEEPKAETTIRGPHEGFTENILTNVGLIRNRIRNPALRFEKMCVGSQTETTLLMVYLENLAPEPLVQEVRSRLEAIQTDSILESSYVEEFIQSNTWSPFPTLTNTERPDVMAAQLLDGKVAIMVNGTPNVLLAPVTFFEFFNSPEDYYQRADIATFIRWIRLFSFFTAVFVPALFVAATTFHQELIPTQLLISLSAQREGVPLPALFEVLFMEVMFEIIREAGLRMPRAVGQSLSILGAIILGQAAVEAGLISAAIVIVVAITGITNFVVPVYSFGMSQRLLRFSFLLLAGFMGLFGVLCGGLFLTAHLVSLKSFGIPYMSPASPFYKRDWKDILFRLPWHSQHSDRLPRFLQNLKRTKR